MSKPFGVLRRTRACGLAAAGAVLAGMTGCGGDGQPASSATGSDLIRVRYTTTGTADGEQQRMEQEVILDGDRRVRITYTAGAGEIAPGTRFVWDGHAVLEYFPDTDEHRRVANPTEQDRPPSYIYQPGSERFKQACAGARRLGTDTILGRVAERYACARTEEGEVTMEAHEMSLDQATGLLLRDAGDGFATVATEVEFNPAIAADTFSTDLPKGAEDAAHPRLDQFRLPRIGGGELALADYAGQPLVIVAGDAAGIRQLAARLLPMTGDKARVLGMLIAIPPENWKGSLLNPADAKSYAASVSESAGTFQIPVGIDIKGAAGYQITGPAGVEAGQTRPTAVGFVSSDSTLAHVTTDAATDFELRDQVSTLNVTK